MTVTMERRDAEVHAILVDGREAGRLERRSDNVWQAKMNRFKTYTGREFASPGHALAFFDEQFQDEPCGYRWTILWTDGTAWTGASQGALAAWDEIASAVTYATSPQRENPKRTLLYTIARNDGELSATTFIAPHPGQHGLTADAEHCKPRRHAPGLPMHPIRPPAPAGHRDPAPGGQEPSR
ncbi:MAG: hypothetical protein OXG35_28650 [Acidobacteria bacterium]|nr:hypothetical protein [Acidobacteriota bacterium]